MSNFKDVQELYRNKFSIIPNTNVTNKQERLARADFIEEELAELRLAIDNENKLGEIDALIDLVYVAMGSAALLGINWNQHWALVHKANMKKVSGHNDKRPNMTRDLHKPENWKAPDHYPILNKKPRIMLIGHTQHGKDTVAELLAKDYGFSNVSASKLFAEYIMLNHNHGRYNSVQECYEDRINNREYWFNTIADYNSPNKARLAELVYSQSDVYTGVRDASELWAINEKNLYDLCIWVDASARLPLESKASMNVTEHMAEITINNNGSIDNLRDIVNDVMKAYGYA